MDKLIVEGRTDLVRDPHSKAILFVETAAMSAYRKKRERELAKEALIDQLCRRIDALEEKVKILEMTKNV